MLVVGVACEMLVYGGRLVEWIVGRCVLCHSGCARDARACDGMVRDESVCVGCDGWVIDIFLVSESGRTRWMGWSS